MVAWPEEQGGTVGGGQDGGRCVYTREQEGPLRREELAPCLCVSAEPFKAGGLETVGGQAEEKAEAASFRKGKAGNHLLYFLTFLTFQS